MIDFFRKGKFEYAVNGIFAGVQEMESVVVLLNSVWHSVIIYFGCVTSRILEIIIEYVMGIDYIFLCWEI